MVFIMLLLVIVVIVTVHSISMEIESNYVTFGVLKAQGFGKHKMPITEAPNEGSSKTPLTVKSKSPAIVSIVTFCPTSPWTLESSPCGT